MQTGVDINGNCVNCGSKVDSTAGCLKCSSITTVSDNSGQQTTVYPGLADQRIINTYDYRGIYTKLPEVYEKTLFPPQATYIALDNETGGVSDDSSLLTSYLAILDQNFQLMDELDLTMKPKDGIYHVNGEALGVNHINLVEHDKVAITYQAAGTKLYEFLKKHTNNGVTKLIPWGHNVNFDIMGLQNNIITKNSWNHFVSYRVIDSGVCAQVMKIIGLLPDDNKGSLEHLASFFKLEHGVLHTAKADTLLTIEVIKSMIKLLKGDL
jgi:DNA polymerase III alpha subunit (gram-positive type)